MLRKNLVLRPNCLLTRYPLVFLTGPRSLFNQNPDAFDLQYFISEHGYQIERLILPLSSKKERAHSFLKWLKENPLKSFHFILAEETYSEFKDFIHLHIFEDIKYSTLTVIHSNEAHYDEPLYSFKVSRISAPLFYEMHTLYCKIIGVKPLNFENTLNKKNELVYDRFLDHCIQLAENDYAN